MRKATVAKLSLTAAVGFGALFGSTNLAEAGPAPVNGSIKVAPPTTSTTMKPLQADPVEYCDLHLCLDAVEVDPTPPAPPKADLPLAQPEDDGCNSLVCDGPDDKIAVPGDDDDDCNLTLGCDDLPIKDAGCQWTHGCPEDEGGTGGGTDGSGTDGGTEGTDGQTSDGGQADDGTDGGTTGGGRLPKTGGDIMAIAGTGLGLTGLGAAIRRLARRNRG